MSLMESNSGGGRAAPVGVPDSELVERPRRRRFSAEYKLGIVGEADACSRPGEVGALLRREGLYTSHLTYWREQRDAGALVALGARGGASPPTGVTRSSPRCVAARSARRRSW